MKSQLCKSSWLFVFKIIGREACPERFVRLSVNFAEGSPRGSATKGIKMATPLNLLKHAFIWFFLSQKPEPEFCLQSN
jgi:hypothetical protein